MCILLNLIFEIVHGFSQVSMIMHIKDEYSDIKWINYQYIIQLSFEFPLSLTFKNIIIILTSLKISIMILNLQW